MQCSTVDAPLSAPRGNAVNNYERGPVTGRSINSEYVLYQKRLKYDCCWADMGQEPTRTSAKLQTSSTIECGFRTGRRAVGPGQCTCTVAQQVCSTLCGPRRFLQPCATSELHCSCVHGPATSLVGDAGSVAERSPAPLHVSLVAAGNRRCSVVERPYTIVLWCDGSDTDLKLEVGLKASALTS
jgi:hypothetical protein